MLHRSMRLVGLACAFAALASTAFAQLPQVGGYKDAANAPQLGIGVGVFGLDSGTGLRCAVGSTSTCQVPTGGTFTASLAGFRPTVYATPITATTSGVTGTLPAGAQVVATDTDASNPVYCALGASASTSSQYIAPGGGWFGFAVSGDTQLTCITATGTAKVNIAGGTGLPTGTGGGGSGGGNVNLTGINSVTPLAGAGATGTGSLRTTTAQDTTTIAGSAPGTAGTASANVLSVQGISGGTTLPVADASLLSAVNGATPAGTNIIGKVGIDQTTPGTTNGVQTLSGSVTTATLGAGTALAGKFGIDQTTNGTTNAIVAVAAPTGGTTGSPQAALTNTAVAIKASAGSVFMVNCYNPNASVAYIQVFNVAAGSVTVGTTAPSRYFGIPPGLNGGFANSLGAAFTIAISWAATTTPTGGTGPGTSLVCDAEYN